MMRAQLKGIAAGIIAALLGAAVAVPVHAADVPSLLAKRRCNACHDVSKTLIGPPLNSIAIRYRNANDQQVETLARKVVTGGGGAWGVVPMVPNEHVPLDEARAMVKWILALPAR
jgi:cytochrome c